MELFQSCYGKDKFETESRVDYALINCILFGQTFMSHGMELFCVRSELFQLLK